MKLGSGGIGQNGVHLAGGAATALYPVRQVMQLIENIVTKRGDKLGDRKIKSITPLSTGKIYSKIIDGPKGERLRQGEKAVALCRRAWHVVHGLHPGEFSRDVPNPWNGLALKRRVKKKKPAVRGWQLRMYLL